VQERVFVVFNPRSGKGRGARLVEPVLAGLRAGGGVEHALTTRPREEEALAEQAARAGFRTIAAVGGDGTWGNAANGILKSGAAGVRLALLPGGTGCDFAKSVGIPVTDLAACVRLVRDGRPSTVDVGRIEDRYFLNVAGFGFDIAVIERSLRVRRLSGDLLYVYCALRELFAFAGFEVELAADAEPPERRDLMMLILANARVFGGAFRIAPGAELDDGRLDLVGFANLGPAARMGMLGRVLRGSHVGARGVETRRVGRLGLRFAAPPAYETDGEWNQARSADLVVESVPGALTVMAGA
jgi:diacylglycerol kinase (ATP)